MGLETLLYPLFEIAPLAWCAPEPDAFDALMLTSANAARRAGPDLTRYAAVPLYVVGEATAKAARALGLKPAHVGTRDAAALAEDMRRAGVRRALHLCGADVVAAEVEGVSILRVPVYHAREAGDADSLAVQLRADDICLVHSPRAGARLATLVPPETRAEFSLIAISGNALTAAGTGWADALAAPAPTDPAMLALAQELCQNPQDAARRR
jgi:uroporphyrinogen-III synthase